VRTPYRWTTLSGRGGSQVACRLHRDPDVGERVVDRELFLVEKNALLSRRVEGDARQFFGPLPQALGSGGIH
jgi:hypothetical protein